MIRLWLWSFRKSTIEWNVLLTLLYVEVHDITSDINLAYVESFSVFPFSTLCFGSESLCLPILNEEEMGIKLLFLERDALINLYIYVHMYAFMPVRTCIFILHIGLYSDITFLFCGLHCFSLVIESTIKLAPVFLWHAPSIRVLLKISFHSNPP
jgi:hypothetical protein